MLSVLIGVCIWVLGLYKLEALGALMALLNYALRIVSKLSCSCLCLFDAIDEFHAMNENDYFNGKWNFDCYEA